MRQLQFTYWLEPAGSHGVWGLDDYHFLPFLFGSAQLMGHKYIKPKSIHSTEIVDEFSKDYMYLACIQFINSVKTESLPWHSPMLNDISAVKTWTKVNEGMLKMYKAEVMSKLPIMQHFRFGSILALDGPRREEDEASSDNITGVEKVMNNEHVHVFAYGQEFPSCCGIRIPSAIAASKGVVASVNDQTQSEEGGESYLVKHVMPNGKIVIKSTGPTLSLPFD